MRFLALTLIIVLSLSACADDFSQIQNIAEQEGNSYTVSEQDTIDYHTGLLEPDFEQIYKMPDLFEKCSDFLKARLLQATESDKETISGLLEALRETGKIGMIADSRTGKIGFFETGIMYLTDPGLNPVVIYETEDSRMAKGICRYFHEIDRHVFKNVYGSTKCLTAALHDVTMACSETISQDCVEYLININYTTLMTVVEKDDEVEESFIGSFKEGIFITDVQTAQ